MLIDSNLNLSLQKSEDPNFPTLMRTFSCLMRIISERMRIYLSPTRILSGRIRPEVCSLQNFFCSHQNFRRGGKAFPVYARRRPAHGGSMP